MWSTPTIIAVVVSGLVLLQVVFYVATGNVGSAVVILLLAAAVGFVLTKLGVINIQTDKGGAINVSLYEKAPAPAPAVAITPAVLEQKEVFFISGNDYTYDEAPAVCAAYDGELATYDQVNEAYSSGAEWCGYGWTQSGMALFPTQEATWNALQQEMTETKRTSCGRPGVNGGYFNPNNKFGVNCYGVKPQNRNTKFPLPIPGTDSNTFNQMVDKYKSMLSRMTVSAFNRVGWSEWNMSDKKQQKKHK
jgi:hypothetical protein